MNNFYEPRNSVYCYPNSEVLVNKFDVKTWAELFKIENDITIYKLYMLREKGITGNFDVEHFISIHRFLFEDIYPFAGLYRNENIAKDNFMFANWEFIEDNMNMIFGELKSENYLVGLDKVKLAERLSYYMAELNVLHPFREGNGRTTREFIRQLALKNGYNLDLSKFDAQDILRASIESVIDMNKLQGIIYTALIEVEE